MDRAHAPSSQCWASFIMFIVQNSTYGGWTQVEPLPLFTLLVYSSLIRIPSKEYWKLIFLIRSSTWSNREELRFCFPNVQRGKSGVNLWYYHKHVLIRLSEFLIELLRPIVLNYTKVPVSIRDGLLGSARMPFFLSPRMVLKFPIRHWYAVEDAI